MKRLSFRLCEEAASGLSPTEVPTCGIGIQHAGTNTKLLIFSVYESLPFTATSVTIYQADLYLLRSQPHTQRSAIVPTIYLLLLFVAILHFVKI